eukprot:2541173-Amphidinium_carterae.1
MSTTYYSIIALSGELVDGVESCEILSDRKVFGNREDYLRSSRPNLQIPSKNHPKDFESYFASVVVCSFGASSCLHLQEWYSPWGMFSENDHPLCPEGREQ